MNTIIPVGGIIPFSGQIDKAGLERAGWLYCDGSDVSRSDYGDLFKVIGTLYGSGDGTTTYRLPDYRGTFLRGVDGGAGLDPNASTRTPQVPDAAAKGDEVGSVQGDEFKSHTHSYTKFPGDSGDIASGRYWQSEGGTTGATGGDETRPKNIYVHYIIRYKD